MPELQPFTFHQKLVTHPVDVLDVKKTQSLNSKQYLIIYRCFVVFS